VPINNALAAVGVAKQSAKGTPATQPTFLFGATGGKPMVVDIDQPEEQRTLLASRNAAGVNRQKVAHGMNFSCRAHPEMIGLLLYGALGAISSSGTGPTTHTITPGTDLPYLTFWGLYAGSIFRVQDAKIDELTLKLSGPGPIELDLTAWGAIPGYPGSVTPAHDEQNALYYQGGGGLFKEDTSSATPATANVTEGELKISNGVAPLILARSVVPQDVTVAHQSIAPSFTLVPDVLDEWRKIVTGSGSGTTIAEQPVYGSYEEQFVLDANTSIDILCPRVGFACEMPDMDPGGGPASMQMAGVAVNGVSGAVPLTATVKNDITTY
jgi:hypothetical protein